MNSSPIVVRLAALLRRVCLAACLGPQLALGADEPPALPVITDVPAQPLVAQTRRLIEAATLIGAPFSAADIAALETSFRAPDDAETVQAIQRVLDPYCLIGIQINPESRVKVAVGLAKPELL